MTLMRKLFIILASAIAIIMTSTVFTACRRHSSTDRPPRRAMYWWSTRLVMDSSKAAFLRTHSIDRLYLRFFDVVCNGSGLPVPNATLQFATPLPSGVEVVPTVFVMPECLRGDRQRLAALILQRVLQMCSTNDVQGVKELQIDCDWTSSTRQAYNTFMADMLKICHAHRMRLSSTIRLHQLAQSPPPADRGVLMMYNTGNVADIHCHKPILDMHDAAPYLPRLASYPLPMSAAYPVFSWRVLFRGGQFVGIMHSDDEYPRLPSDSVCIREPSLQDITDAIRAVNKRRPDANDEIIIFDLSNNNLKRFNANSYEKIFNRGRNARRTSGQQDDGLRL